MFRRKITSRSVRAWIAASRPPAQSYIALPLLLGQAIAFRQGDFAWWILAWVQLFGLFDHLYIVFGNDLADRTTDLDNATYTAFSGGSRVLVEGSLQPEALARGAALMAVGILGTGAVLALGFARPWALALCAFALLLLWAYSYPPLELSYRGGGELLQTLGVGLCLPLFAYYCQAGRFVGFPYGIYAVLLPTHLACAIATTLPDEPSDRRADKRTVSVVLGPNVAARATGALDLVALGALLAQPRLALSVLPAPGIAIALWAVLICARLLFPARPAGSRGLSLQVAAAVATTLTLVAALLAGAYLGGGP